MFQYRLPEDDAMFQKMRTRSLSPVELEIVVNSGFVRQYEMERFQDGRRDPASSDGHRRYVSFFMPVAEV